MRHCNCKTVARYFSRKPLTTQLQLTRQLNLKTRKQPKALTYRDAGVDIDAGDNLVENIKPYAKRTMRPGVMAGIGGFGALFRVPRGYKEPVLVASCDGVGTKLKIAFAAGIHNTVGYDLVSHCFNDILVQGAKPLFFMDYYPSGKHDVK